MSDKKKSRTEQGKGETSDKREYTSSPAAPKGQQDKSEDKPAIKHEKPPVSKPAKVTARKATGFVSDPS